MTVTVLMFGGMAVGAVADYLDRWANGWAFFAVTGGWAGYGLYVFTQASL